MTKRNFDNFDEHAEDYRQIHSENVRLSGADSFYFAEFKVKELLRSENVAGIRILDVGCGDGVTEFFIKKYMSTWRVQGIDVSKESIARAKEKKIPDVTFSVFDGQHIPFEDSHFDVVFLAAVLHHIDFSFHNSFLTEIYRVLKPGGRIYVFEHNPLNPVTRYFVNTCIFDKDAKLLGFQYCKKLLKSVKFTGINRKFILFFPRKGPLSWMIKLENKLSWLPLGAQYMYKAVK